MTLMIKKKLTRIGRRSFLLGLGTLIGTGAWAIADPFQKPLKNQIKILYAENRNFTVRGNKSLRDRAAAKGLIYGAATLYEHLYSDREFAQSFAQECGILVTEGNLKWGAIRPSPDSFDFSRADWMLEFAQAHNMLFRGHTLLWYISNPPWFKEKVNRQNAEELMVKHIETVVGRYAGKIHSWDVVNEGIHPDDGRPDSLRNSPWLEFVGPNYIDLAFRVAAKADPKALLVYNDYGLDYDRPRDEARRIAVLKLLERLKSKGTPVQALGIQAHLGANEAHFNPQKLRDFLRDVASLGLKILVTEMDVVDKLLPADIAIRDRIIAGIYEDYLSVVLDEPATIAVITWGLSDRYTWLKDTARRQDGMTVRPLPLDSKMNRKLPWNAIARSFDRYARRQADGER